jgi:hypothetical protein
MRSGRAPSRAWPAASPAAQGTSTTTSTFEADVSALLRGLSAVQRRLLPALPAQVVIGHADPRGIDVFDTGGAGSS